MKKPPLSPAQIAAICRLFTILSEPNRVVLLQILEGGPLTVSELVEATSMKQPTVSKHLAVLHDHHLVKRERAGVSVRYEIADPMIFALCNLVCGKMQRDAKKAVAVFHPEISALSGFRLRCTGALAQPGDSTKSWREVRLCVSAPLRGREARREPGTTLH